MGYGLRFAMVKPWQLWIPMNLASMPLVRLSAAVNDAGEHWSSPEKMNNKREHLDRRHEYTRAFGAAGNRQRFLL